MGNQQIGRRRREVSKYAGSIGGSMSIFRVLAVLAVLMGIGGEWQVGNSDIGTLVLLYIKEVDKVDYQVLLLGHC